MKEVAVIDVGSNSVRLVAYRLDGRATTPFFNEKVMAGLGRNLTAGGPLSPEAVDVALRALARFAALVAALGIKDVDVVATAAIRDAGDGPAFVERVKRETGLSVRIISGPEEARLSALGVLSGSADATGLVGDLGGSSLELIEVERGAPGRGETWRLGPFSLMEGGPFEYARVVRAVADALSRSKVIADRGGDFHAVGGAWRALGRIDIALRRHPLGVLHQHEISRADVFRVAEFVRRQSKRTLELLEEAAAKRADSLPYAAVVLEQVMIFGGFDRVVLSSYGLREGLLETWVPAAERSVDPLIASAEAFGAPLLRARKFGRALEAWLAPAFESLTPVFSTHRDRIVRAAACRLADLGAGLHPDQRGEIMFDMVLRAPFAGITHAERAFLAAAIHHRYTRAAPDGQAAYRRLLTDDQRRAALALGAALRLGAELSGRAEAILSAFRLRLADGALQLTTDAGHAHLMTDPALKRLDPLAEALGVPARAEVA